MDITKPNAAPESSSRPIIVTNRPLLQDPMMTDAAPSADDDDAKPNPGPLAGSSKKIQPLADESSEETPSTDNESVTQETEDALVPEEAEDTDEKETEKESSPEDDDKAQAAVVDAVVAGSTKSTDQVADDIESARQEKVQQLIESKKYVVPLGQATKRKQHQQSVIMLVVLLVIVGVYLAADFGLIPLPFELPFQFFQ